MTFISAVFSLLISLCFSVRISQPYKSDGIAKLLLLMPDVDEMVGIMSVNFDVIGQLIIKYSAFI
jgi:hypothetical protein